MGGKGQVVADVHLLEAFSSLLTVFFIQNEKKNENRLFNDMKRPHYNYILARVF